jgi:hypothetical protein
MEYRSNYVEKTFLHEVSESDEEEYEIVAKKNQSLIKLKGILFCSIFSLFSVFRFCGRLNNFSAD